ncbi:MAG: LPS export ABC transporter periplasmic protein LptC [Syntrophales bacterium]|jgi:LPS export ABC transporter protein LptC
MKFKRRNIVIAVLAVAIVTGAAVLLFLESGKSSKNQLLNIVSDKVDLQVKDVHYTDVGASGVKWEINANSAKYVKNENLVLFDRVRVKLVMSDGRTLVMTGDKGKSNTETKDMEISGNVEITSDKGDHLTTDILRYSGAQQRIYTDSAVKMENSRMQVKGVGLSFSLEDKDVALLSKVKANIK